MDNLLSNNKVVLLIALILAIFLWVSVRGSSSPNGLLAGTPTYNAKINVPVTVQNISTQLALNNSNPKVQLSLEGNNQVVLWEVSLNPSLIHCTANASGLKAGTHELALTVTGLPAGVSAVNPVIKVQLLPITTKSMSVHVVPEGSLSTGYTLGKISVDPQDVTLKGPAKLVDSVQKITADFPLQKSDTKTITRTVLVRALNALGQQVKQVQISPQTVSITVQIQKPTKSIPVKVQTEGLPQNGYMISSVSSNPATVNVLGELNSIHSYPIPAINVTGLSVDHTYQVKLQLLPGITQVTPNQISVTVHVVPTFQRTISNVPIHVINVPSGYLATLSRPIVNVVATGSKAAIDALKSSYITVFVDASTVTPTNPPSAVLVALKVQGPNGVQVQLSGKSTVHLTLTKASQTVPYGNSTNTTAAVGT